MYLKVVSSCIIYNLFVCMDNQCYFISSLFYMEKQCYSGHLFLYFEVVSSCFIYNLFVCRDKECCFVTSLFFRDKECYSGQLFLYLKIVTSYFIYNLDVLQGRGVLLKATVPIQPGVPHLDKPPGHGTQASGRRVSVQVGHNNYL